MEECQEANYSWGALAENVRGGLSGSLASGLAMHGLRLIQSIHVSTRNGVMEKT